MTSHSFSDVYISMCKAAEEIQANKMRSMGDWIYNRGEDEKVHLVSNSFNVLSYCTWIPRLDQLLGVVGTPCTFVHAIAHAGDGPGIYFNRDAEEEADWHELALAVVMREKFSKTWRDGKWVKV